MAIRVQNSAPLLFVVMSQGTFPISPFLLQGADSEFLVLAIEIHVSPLLVALVSRLIAEAVEVALVMVVVAAVDVVGRLAGVVLNLAAVVVVVPSFSAVPKMDLELGAEAVDVSLVVCLGVVVAEVPHLLVVADTPRLQTDLGGVVVAEAPLLDGVAVAEAPLLDGLAVVEFSPSFSEIVDLGSVVAVAKASTYWIHLPPTNLVPGWAPAVQVTAATSMLMQASARTSCPVTRI
jgi:hypothetical protein